MQPASHTDVTAPVSRSIMPVGDAAGEMVVGGAVQARDNHAEYKEEDARGHPRQV